MSQPSLLLAASPKYPPGLIFLTLLICLSVGACNKGPNPEDEVRAVIATVRDAADRGDLKVLAAHIAEGYRDHQGRDRAAALKMLTRRTRRHRNRFVSIKVRRVEVGDDGRARVLALAGLASGTISEDKRPVEVSANLLRFRLVLTRGEATWQVVQAEWRRANPLEML